VVADDLGDEKLTCLRYMLKVREYSPCLPRHFAPMMYCFFVMLWKVVLIPVCLWVESGGGLCVWCELSVAAVDRRRTSCKRQGKRERELDSEQ